MSHFQLHRIPIAEKYFILIRNGIKSIEGKKNSPKWQVLKVGDSIEFLNEGSRRSNNINDGKYNEYSESIVATITHIELFEGKDCLYRMLTAVGTNVTLGRGVPFNGGMEIYEYYLGTSDEIDKVGMLAISFKIDKIMVNL